MTIGYDEWRGALEEIEATDDDGKLVREWAGELKWSMDKTSAWLRIGLDNGWVKRGRSVREQISGRPCTYTVFRLAGNHGEDEGA